MIAVVELHKVYTVNGYIVLITGEDNEKFMCKYFSEDQGISEGVFIHKSALRHDEYYRGIIKESTIEDWGVALIENCYTGTS